MASNPRQITSADLFFFFHAPKTFNKPFEFLLYLTNRLHFSVRVYCNRSQETSQRVKNNSHATSLHAVTSSVIYYSTHTRKNVIYLSNNELCYFMCRGQILPVHMLSNTESVELIYENDKYCVQVK